MSRFVVDGMNVIGSRPTGWWRDRPGAMRGLVEELREFAAREGHDVTVVFDGRPFELEGDGVDEVGEIVKDGGTSTVEAEVQAGEYTFYCSVPGHREGGMEGTLTVE